MKQAKRHKTYFGVPIPGFKEEKLGAGAVTIRFVITGKVPSKKNNQQAITVRKKARQHLKDLQASGKPLTWAEAHKVVKMCYAKMRANTEYQAFLKKVKPVLQEQSAYYAERLRDRGLVFPIPKASMSLQFYFNNRYVTDTVNKQQTVQDLLIDAGIIVDDDYSRLNPIHSASACYVDELIHNIAFIQLTFRLDEPRAAESTI